MTWKGHYQGPHVLIWAYLVGLIVATLKVTSAVDSPPITGSQTQNSKGKLPNVLVFMADDLGMGDVGCFGNDTLRTPNLDRLAEEGVKMTHSLAAAPVCTPSRAAFLTGRYPIRYGMVPFNFIRVSVYASSSSGMPQSEYTFAQAAKSKGYSTGFFGKWHLGNSCSRDDFCHHPLKFGFDYFFGLPLTNLRDFGNDGAKVIRGRNPWLELIFYSISSGGVIFSFFLRKMNFIGKKTSIALSVFFLMPGLAFLFLFYTFKRSSGLVLRQYDLVEQPIQLEGFTHRLVREGVEFLQNRREDDKPFLLIMSWLQVHTALHAVSPFAGRSKHGKYGDEVEELDWSVGQILKALDDFGFTQDTIVYFTSDNGGHVEEVGLHGNREGGHNGIFRGGKGQGAMDGAIRVPTMARWPGVIPPNTTLDTPVSLMDIFPTLLHIWDMPLPSDRIIDGVNILPLLQGLHTEPPHDFFVHYCGDLIHGARLVIGNGEEIYKAHFATPNWWPGTEGCGFICDCRGRNLVTWQEPPLLVDMVNDPGERHLLDVTEPKYSAILEEIKRRVEEHKRSVEPVESQFTWTKLLPRPWAQMCCNFPHCSCVDPKYEHTPKSLPSK